MILLLRIEWAPFITFVSEKLHCRQPSSLYVLVELPAECLMDLHDIQCWFISSMSSMCVH